MIALALLAQAAAASGPAFAPPVGRMLRLRSEQARSDGTRTRRFIAERRIAFRRDAAGYVAEVTLVSVGSDAEPSLAARYTAAAGALRGVAVRFRVDADGNIGTVEDEAAVWQRMIAGVRRLAAATAPPSDALAHDPAGPLLALAAPQRHAMLTSMLAPVVAVADARAADGARPVSLPGTLLGAGAAAIAGQRTVSTDAGGKRHLVIRGSGSGNGRAVSIDRERVVDPATGLLSEQREMLVTRVGDTALTTVETITVS